MMTYVGFCLESVSKGFTKDEQNEISLNGIDMIFQSIIVQEDILDTCVY